VTLAWISALFAPQKRFPHAEGFTDMHTAYRISRSRSSGQLRIAAVFVAMAALAGAQQVRPDQIGYFVSSGGAPGTWNWFLDANGDGTWDAGDTLGYIGQSGDIAVVGDWNGSGTKKIGIFRNGLWVLDYNGNGAWDGTTLDRAIYLGQAGDIPVVGDWNGDGRDKVGIFRNGLWVLDYNGNGMWDGGLGSGLDLWASLGQAGDIPVVGDWNGSGTKKIGIFRPGTTAMWLLDYNGDFQWDGTPADRLIYLGQSGDIPVAGDWNGDGRDKVGVFRSGLWVLDYNGNGVWDGPSIDRTATLGQAGDIPVLGDWNGSGTKKIGVFRAGTTSNSGLWVLDYNGNFQWDGPSIDRAYTFGGSGDTPVVGKWPSSGTTPAQFTLYATPSSKSTVQGGSAQYQVTVTPSAGFSGTVVLSAQGLPIGVNAAFSPASVTGSGPSSSFLTLTTNNPNTPLGSAPITVTGASGNSVGAGTVVVLTVTSPTAPPQGQTTVPASSTVIPFGWVSPAETLMFTTNTNSPYAPQHFSVIIENAGTYNANGNVVPTHACYIEYFAPNYGNVLALGNDNLDGTYWVNPGGTTPGTSCPASNIQCVSNSQCTLDVARSWVQVVGSQMTLQLALMFPPSWTGAKEMFVDTDDTNSNQLYWTNRGSWTVPNNSLVPVTTDHYDVFRTGANVHETILTPSNAGSLSFKKALPIDNCAWAQPLYVPGVSINGVAHNVVYVATSNASIYAFDADDSSTTPLWPKRSLGTPSVWGWPDPGYWDCTAGATGGPAGIVGTPVIDLSSNTMYVVGNLQVAGNTQHKLFGIDISSGLDRLAPRTIVSSGQVSATFVPSQQLQRPGLLLADYSVLVPYASYADNPPYQGWMFSFNRGNLGLLDDWSYAGTTVGGAGIWMSGGGAAFDGTKVYFSTGNPRPDTNPIGYSHSLLQVDPYGGPPPGTPNVGLANINQFLPSQASDWVGKDRDLGSSRVIVVPGTNDVLVGGKAGNIYVLDRTAPIGSNSLLNAFNVDDPTHSAALDNGFPEISGGLAYWNGAIYTWASGDHLRSFSLQGTPSNTSPGSITPNGEQGAAISISANFDMNGLIWVVFPDGVEANHNPQGTGRLLVYDVANLNQYIGAGYDLKGDFVLKFTAPMVANGKVFVATQGQPPAISPRLLVYAP